MKPLLSIVIPCYKSEFTLQETLESVVNQDFDSWEALIINDGSPDNLETIALKWVQKDTRFKYFKKENEGLGKTRNYGIKKAQGDIILPLDSDNKIRPNFVKENIKKFDSDSKIGVIYGNAEYFGEKEGAWIVGTFDKHRLLYHNYIDACALIRKSVLEQVNCFEENLPFQGHEDWDLWLKIMASKFDFLYVDKITFDYRVTHNSMIKSFDDDMLNANISFIKNKHSNLYIQAMSELYEENVLLKYELKNSKKIRFLQKLRNIKKRLS
ncbi:glycosyltransferase family 2 protein [Winogradskyella alexanderae]|uniref:Glycosyltransferase n=1 Tax=Winogradskyella alexanderae TaxID=2877123 RepID=A0ABS7XPP2_9FLAO|nr:glycosyltransferase family 2 protein [Winogradskyella alexanderae]MCA0131982.1 glycosyltransferase [Winogradskyella alexanderae]